MSLRIIIKQFWKPFVFIFLLVFLLINWQDIALVFNYRVIYGRLKSLAGDKKLAEVRPLPVVRERVSGKEDSVVIPKIDVEAPIILVDGQKTQPLEKYLTKGVLLFPDSVLPGQQGRTIILGHSAPANWPDVNYDRIFTELNELVQGDEIYVYFNKQEYVYRVKNKFFLDKGEELPEHLTETESVLVLLSCWPPGKDQKRIAVEAVETNRNL